MSYKQYSFKIIPHLGYHWLPDLFYLRTFLQFLSEGFYYLSIPILFMQGLRKERKIFSFSCIFPVNDIAT